MEIFFFFHCDEEHLQLKIAGYHYNFSVFASLSSTSGKDCMTFCNKTSIHGSDKELQVQRGRNAISKHKAP